MEAAVTILGVLVALVIVLAIYQTRRANHYLEISKRIEEEKQAVIALMDNIGERMTKQIDLNATLEVIAQYVVQATRAESGAIFLLSEDEQSLQAKVIVGLFPPLFEDAEIAGSKHKYLAEKIRKRRIGVGEGIIGSVLRSEKPLLITDAEADPRIPRTASQLFPLQSLVLCPLRARGRDLGVLVIVNKQGDAIFTGHDTQLLLALADQAAITVDLVKLYDVVAEQQRLEQELRIADEFQRMLLPRQCPQLPGFEFSARNESALVVGGDFYDFFEIDQDHLGVAIGDVSGKGIPGALVMAAVKSILRAEAAGSLSPRDVLRRVNGRVLADTQESVFVTITYGILDLTTRRFRFARAGHEPVLVRQGEQNGPVRVVLSEGMAVGLAPAEMFELIEEVELQLSPGDSVLLYTDGAIEAINPAAEEYGRERLIENFSQYADLPAEEQIERLSNEIRQFSAGIPQHDDITMVVFRVKPTTGSSRRAGSGERGESLIEPASQTA